MPIGERINRLRVLRNLSLEEVGEYIGVGRQTVYKYERGIVTNIPSDKLEKMADILRTSPGYLMGWTDDPGEAYPDDPGEVPTADKVWELREALRRNPRYALLFDAAAKVKESDIQTAVRLLEALKGEDR